MKNIMFGFLIFQTVNAFAVTPPGDLGLNANSLKLKVYKMAVSTSANCTNPLTVINNGASAVETDVKGANPVFGNGNIPNGTYPCVMLEVSDTIKYSGQTSTSGNCSPYVETTRDLCRLSNGGTSKLLDGSTFSCTASEDHVVLYLSTNTKLNPNNNGFVPPVGANSDDGVHLGAPLVVSGSAAGKLIANTDGQLCDNENAVGSDCDGVGTDAHVPAACRLEGVNFSFTN